MFKSLFRVLGVPEKVDKEAKSALIKRIQDTVKAIDGLGVQDDLDMFIELAPDQVQDDLGNDVLVVISFLPAQATARPARLRLVDDVAEVVRQFAEKSLSQCKRIDVQSSTGEHARIDIDSLAVRDHCPRCKGAGVVGGETCPMCEGSGKNPFAQPGG